jgi:maltooligosyltrehalose trehalohydrolase
LLVAENEPQDVRLIRPLDQGGFGIDAMWNDDFHHSAMVSLTGRREGYYHDYLGRAQEFVSALKRGFLYQGQRYDWQHNPRGTRVTDEPAAAFVHFIQNHDQVGNTLFGERIDKTAASGRLRALTAVTLLGPETPMLFMGQEYGAPNCFCYFADHGHDLAAMVHKGRRDFLRQFKTFAVDSAQAVVPNPADERLFELAKLDRSQAKPEMLELHKSLLALRRTDPVVSQQRRDRIDGGVFNDHAFVIRWFDETHGDRLLVVNLGGELIAVPAPDPLLAPMTPAGWAIGWSSDEPAYGGPGAANPCERDGWRLPGESAVFLVPAEHKEPA